MRVAGFIMNSVVNGHGIRDVVFLQGCNHHCEGCHNPETWNMADGEYMAVEDVYQRLKKSKNNVTISGGDPILQFKELLELCELLHKDGKDIWVYTGFEFGELLRVRWELLLSVGVSVVVDGRFIEELKDLTLQFRGSSNQRLIDLEKTINDGVVTLWKE